MEKAVIFSAPSGAGKTTIVHALMQTALPLGFSVSATSRPPRGNETNGTDYFFYTAEEFRNKISEQAFIEWEEVYDGLFYGTLRSEVERIWKEGKAVVFDVDVKGGIALKKIFGHQAISLFIQPPSLRELENRLRNRHTETEASIKKRLDRAQFELTFSNQFDHVVINDNLSEASHEAFMLVSAFLKQ